MRRYVLTTLLAGVVMFAAGCHRRPLYDMDDLLRIKVTIDLDTVSNVMTNIYNENVTKPNTNTDKLRVFLYDHDRNTTLAQTFLDDKSWDEAGHQVLSGYMHISYGTFDFLIYNFDTPNNLYKNENSESSIEAYTSEMTRTPEDLTVSYQPDHLMVAREQGFRVSPHTETPTLETTAHTCINTYYIQIHVEGMRYVTGCSATISGLYSGNKFGCDSGRAGILGERIDEPSTCVYFTMEKGSDPNLAGENKDVLCALFNTFGKIEDVTSNLYVTFKAVDTEGNQLQKTVNLDVVFRSEDAIERHWLLLDETWTIEDPVPHSVVGGGFQPVVDDWDEQHGEIAL